MLWSMSFDTFWHGTLGRPYRLHVRYTGDPTKQTIVLLHGIAASGEDWNKVLPYLDPNYFCITIDLLGFGKSPKPAWLGYTVEDHIKSLHRTIRSLNISEPYILMGHSLGSLLAVRYARQHPKNIEKLLLLSPPIYPSLESITSRSAKRLTGLLLTIYKFLRGKKMTPETFKRLSYIAPLPKSVITQPDIWVPFMRTLQQCIEKQTVLEDVLATTIPIDICYGTLDQVVINANVELLKNQSNVTLHEFMNTHDLTGRYGKLLARILTPQSMPKN